MGERPGDCRQGPRGKARGGASAARAAGAGRGAWGRGAAAEGEAGRGFGGGPGLSPRTLLAEPGARRAARPAGTQNHSGQSVFSVVPVEGIMDPGKAQDFTVTFSPDHESLYFSDRLQVVLFEKVWLREPSLDPSSRVSRALPAFLACPTLEALAGGWGLRARGVVRWRGQGPRAHGPALSWSPSHGSQDDAAVLLVPRNSPTRSF